MKMHSATGREEKKEELRLAYHVGSRPHFGSLLELFLVFPPARRKKGWKTKGCGGHLRSILIHLGPMWVMCATFSPIDAFFLLLRCFVGPVGGTRPNCCSQYSHGLRPSCYSQYTHGLRPSCCFQYTHGLRPSCGFSIHPWTSSQLLFNTPDLFVQRL